MNWCSTTTHHNGSLGRRSRLLAIEFTMDKKLRSKRRGRQATHTGEGHASRSRPYKKYGEAAVGGVAIRLGKPRKAAVVRRWRSIRRTSRAKGFQGGSLLYTGSEGGAGWLVGFDDVDGKGALHHLRIKVAGCYASSVGIAVKGSSRSDTPPDESTSARRMRPAAARRGLLYTAGNPFT